MAGREKAWWKAGNLVLPAPAALVSCQRAGEAANLITIGWCGNINTNPAMLSISVRPERHSHGIIAATGEFVCNIPGRDMAKAVDYCGVVSGRDVDKFAATGLTPFGMASIACPGVDECPVSIACRVSRTIPLGSHTLFLAEVAEIAVSSDCIDGTGKFRLDRADVLCYAHGYYYGLGGMAGHFGWSVRKKPVSKVKNKAGKKAAGSGRRKGK